VGVNFKVRFQPVRWKYNALSMSMRETLPFKHLVEAVSLIVGYDNNEMTTFKTTVWEDNIGALTLA
jgi:hypothetical protein